MKCPFRIEAVFEYSTIYDKDNNKDYLQKAQRAEFPECYGDDCPYYSYNSIDYGGGCGRIDE